MRICIISTSPNIDRVFKSEGMKWGGMFCMHRGSEKYIRYKILVLNLNIRKRLRNRYKDDIKVDCRKRGCEDVKKYPFLTPLARIILMKYKWKGCVHLFLVIFRNTALGSC
jgi:hypothetical protein